MTMLSRKEFAKSIGVVPHTLDRWCRYGLRGVRLRRIAVGGRFFFNQADFDRWQEEVEEAKQFAAGKAERVQQSFREQKKSHEQAKEFLRSRGFKV